MIWIMGEMLAMAGGFGALALVIFVAVTGVTVAAVAIPASVARMAARERAWLDTLPATRGTPERRRAGRVDSP